MILIFNLSSQCFCSDKQGKPKSACDILQDSSSSVMEQHLTYQSQTVYDKFNILQRFKKKNSPNMITVGFLFCFSLWLIRMSFSWCFPLVRFICADVNRVITLRCGLKQSYPDSLEEVVLVRFQVVHLWCDCDLNQLPGVCFKFEPKKGPATIYALNFGM